jgi:hypothetical protein
MYPVINNFNIQEPEDKREAKKREQEEKRKRDLERKAENRILAEKEASEPPKQPKAAPRKKGKEAAKPAGPGAIAAGSSPVEDAEKVAAPEAVESYSATGLDNALDLMEVVTAKSDKASLGQQAAGLEKHPEVCATAFAKHEPLLIYYASFPAADQGKGSWLCHRSS